MHRRFILKRRNALIGAAALAASTMLAGQGAFAADDEVTVGIIIPTSGPWARPGTLYVQGAELAARHINEQGGIKAIDGAQIKLAIYDAGDSPETARNAAQRMVSQQPDMVAAAGAWLSSFTLSASEVTERAGIALVTGSSADLLTERGFHYIFRTVPDGAAWVEQLTPGIMALSEDALGRRPTTAALIADSTPAPANWSDILRTTVLPREGVSLVVDEVFTPPIADTTSLVQKLRRAQPDIFINIATNVPDMKLFIDKMSELNVKIPTFHIANALASSEVPQVIEQNALDGMLVAINNWGTPDRQSIVDDYIEASGEPFMAQETSNAYADVWLIKEAIEQAGVADREKVAEALRNMHLPMNEGVGRLYYGGDTLAFDEKGNRIGAGMMLVQWQAGQPVVVYPPEMAGGATPLWSK